MPRQFLRVPTISVWSKNKKDRYTLHTQSLLYKSGVQWGYTLHGHVFVMYAEIVMKETIISVGMKAVMMIHSYIG